MKTTREIVLEMWRGEAPLTVAVDLFCAGNGIKTPELSRRIGRKNRRAVKAALWDPKGNPGPIKEIQEFIGYVPGEPLEDS